MVPSRSPDGPHSYQWWQGDATGIPALVSVHKGHNCSVYQQPVTSQGARVVNGLPCYQTLIPD
ncbi:hypothetical protein LY78DRAFT_279690 [Colletotrichum sublineola]|nr:hypothetical protein LY78DRAFT_279690 [Colletotrichum sublineola]